MDPFDLILSNSLPQYLSLVIYPDISLFLYNIILVYKTFIEISGHCGKKLFPIGSFTQFVWLPTFFDITLYSEDHDLHHSKNKYNFSKRFSFWDKLFGTYN